LVSLPGVTFSRKKEGTIMQQVQEALLFVREAEQELPHLVAAVAAEDAASCRSIRDKIFELEAKATDFRRDLSTRIAEGAFFGGVREDMLNLLLEIDKIADKAKDAARLITLATVTDPKARDILRSEDMRQFLANLDLAVVALQHIIEAFEINRKTILERVHSVEKYEEAADTFKQNILVALFERSPEGIDPVTVILVRDFVFCADDVADNAEHASDVVLILVAKGYG
jgi:uncharacterized protein